MNKKITLIILLLGTFFVNKSLFALNKDRSMFNKDILWYSDSFLTVSAGIDSFVWYHVDADGLNMPKNSLNKNGEFIENSLLAYNYAIGGRLSNKSPVRLYLEYNVVSFTHNNVIQSPTSIENVSSLIGVDTLYKNDFEIYRHAIGIALNYDFFLGANKNIVIPYVGVSSFIIMRELKNTNYYLHGYDMNNIVIKQATYSSNDTVFEIEPIIGVALFKGYVSLEYSYAMQVHKNPANYSKIKLLANIPVF